MRENISVENIVQKIDRQRNLTMPTCFVIQPFSSPYNERYADVYEGAIKEAGFEPYRVDQDPSVSVPIHKIEEGIRDADVCFLDVSDDNPNVWFEFGLARAYDKLLCIVCTKRERYPFDAQHLSIINYKTNSLSDFAELAKKIKIRLMAVLQNNEKRAVIETHFTSTNNDGLLPHEISCLASILLEAEGTDSHVNIYSVKKAMERAGYNTLASNIALKKLMNIRYLDSEMDSYERDYPIECYKITKFGWDWVNRNFGLLDLKATPISENHKSQARAFDEQIPF